MRHLQPVVHLVDSTKREQGTLMNVLTVLYGDRFLLAEVVTRSDRRYTGA
jgi:hypothetical protein